VRSIEETEREIGIEVEGEVGAKMRNPMEAGCGEAPKGRSGNEDSSLSKAGSNDYVNADASSDECSRTYCSVHRQSPLPESVRWLRKVTSWRESVTP
jgi:hypothetical protein